VKSVGIPLADGATPGHVSEPVPAHTVDRRVYEPSDDDIRFYEDHGWWISPQILPEEVLDAAHAAANDFYRTGGVPLPAGLGFKDWSPADGLDVLRNNEFVSLRSHGLAKLARSSALGAIAARLARVNEIRILDDQLIWKPSDPKGSRAIIGWHADHAYWGTCSSDRLLARIAGELAAQGREVVPVPFQMKRGQVSFHHGWAVHGSPANQSPNPRVAMAVHFQDGDNRYVPCLAPDGTPVQMADEQFCRRLADGSPDFSDPAIFPRVWPVTEPWD
jgi:hypothetical protein